MDPWSIAGLIALVAGALANYAGTQKQLRNADAAASQALLQSHRQGDDISQKIVDAANQFAVGKTDKDLSDTSDQLTNRYEEPVALEQVKRAAQQGTQGDVSSDYETAKAASGAKDLSDIHNIAALMGKQQASGRMRMNQGFDLARRTADINQALKFNAMDNATAQANINAIASGTNKLNTLGSGLSLAGTALMLGGAFGGAGAPAGGATGATTGTAANVASSGLSTGKALSSSVMPTFSNGAAKSIADSFMIDPTKFTGGGTFGKALGRGISLW